MKLPMKNRPLRFAAVASLAALLAFAAATPTAAQQAAGSVATAEASAGVGLMYWSSAAPATFTAAEQAAGSPSAALPGPRLSPELRGFEPSIAEPSATASPVVAAAGGSNTIVISTLALVLIAVIVTILVVK